MKIQVKGRNVVVTDALQDYAIEKMVRVHRLLQERRIDEVSRVDLELQVEKNPANPNHSVAEATIFTRGPVIRAKESSNDMYAAIDLVADKLQRRVKRYHDKVHRRSYHKNMPKSGLMAAALEAEAAGIKPLAAAGEEDIEVLAASVTAAQDNGKGAATEPVPEQAAADEPGRVVKVKHFALKPMTVEEAVLQLELVGHDFFVFRNADTDSTNVLYRRQDDHYGLIVPERA